MKRFQYIFRSVILVIFITFVECYSQASQTSSNIYGDSVKISLLTCGPGQEVYSYYGHTAIRFQDLRNHQDLVINYGMFSFQQKYFILRFVFGLTDYEMGIIPFESFYEEYKNEGRWVKEQILNLSPKDKENIALAIDKNYQPENRTYRYNYFYDNCTTRARDIIINNINGFVIFHGLEQVTSSYRKEIHQWNSQHLWARWGNDLLLGYKADCPLSMEERQFLPDSLSFYFQHAVVKFNHNEVKNLVSSSHYIIAPSSTYNEKSCSFFNVLTPTSLMICISILLIISGFLQKKYKIFYISIYSILSFITGLCGLVLTAMIFSKHPTVSFNLQILILNPLNILWLFPKIRKAKYFRLLMITCYLLGTIGSFFQSFADGIQLLAFVLLITSIYSYKVTQQVNTAKL
ncbi:MAG: DUF4105 domain-containing protein [Prevotella salivae]|uniref:Lnb N-terminal periplasmic domain-containing protein n=1 Tax=Segatella salivae TaxID=228604 RepID=UPI001CABE2B8|nr:DUF4105 domain-containing protein [Segatella salivae]MBF1524375.1 DUF4105 domain-containing protein [Segatella salivae]